MVFTHGTVLILYLCTLSTKNNITNKIFDNIIEYEDISILPIIFLTTVKNKMFHRFGKNITVNVNVFN